MYYIIVYDIASPKRLPKMLKLMRGYLNHVQNSVFEGELTKSQLAEVRFKSEEIMNEAEDSLIIYCVGNHKWLDREIIGIEKRGISNFL